MWWRRDELQPRQRCRAAINYGFGYCHENGAVAMREQERQPRMIPGNDEDENEEEGTQYNGEEKYRGHNTILIWSFAADHNGGGPRWSTTRPEDDRRPALLEADHARATAYAIVGPRPRTRMDTSRPSSHSTARGGWPKGVSRY